MTFLKTRELIEKLQELDKACELGQITATEYMNCCNAIKKNLDQFI